MSQSFSEMKAELPGYAGALYGTVAGGAIEADGSLRDGELAAHLGEVAAAWHRSYEALGGAVDFGSNDEVLLSASKGYVLLRVHHPTGRYLAVALSASGNIGYLRFRARNWLRTLVAGVA